jgi:[ribosomal protein S5]-alanine N-acetyltransferase
MVKPTLTFLEGKRVRLRPLVETDAHGPYPGWMNSREVTTGNSHGVYPYTPEAALTFIRSLAGREDRIVLAITEPKSGDHVGNISLQSIHPIYRSAELAILLGEPRVFGRGLGTEACSLMVAHGFERLNLHRIYCGTFANNEGMIRIAQKLGMKEEGRRREAAFKDGKYLDIVEFGLLREEFGAQKTRA